MARDKVIKAVHGLWKENQRGITHNELVTRLAGHEIPEGTVDELVRERRIRRFELEGTGAVIYLPNPENMVRTAATESSHTAEVSLGYEPQDETGNAGRDGVRIETAICTERKAWYQGFYRMVRRASYAFRRGCHAFEDWFEGFYSK